MSNKIRVGIVGLGYLGKFHLEKYQLNKSVNVTSIVDTDRKNLDCIGSEQIFKTNSFKKYYRKSRCCINCNSYRYAFFNSKVFFRK